MFEIAQCQVQELAASPEGGVPEWLHLLPAGEIRTYDGRGPYRAPDPLALIRRSLQGRGRLPLDENHATDLAAPKGGPSPARGWLTALEARDDGIWARVDWTREGRRLVADGEYLYISPVIAHDAKGRVVEILRASLTNRPNLQGLTALHAEGAAMEFLEKIRAELGLPDDAGEADALAAVSKLKTDVALQAAQIGAIAKAAGADENAELTVVLSHVQELVDPTKFVPVAEVVALQQELAGVLAERQTQQAEAAKAQAEAFVDAAIAEGRIGVKPLRSYFVSLHMTDAAAAELQVKALPKLGGSGAKATPPEKDKPAGELSEVEARVVQLMGIDPEAYKATRAALGAIEEVL